MATDAKPADPSGTEPAGARVWVELPGEWGPRRGIEHDLDVAGYRPQAQVRPGTQQWRALLTPSAGAAPWNAAAPPSPAGPVPPRSGGAVWVWVDGHWAPVRVTSWSRRPDGEWVAELVIVDAVGEPITDPVRFPYGDPREWAPRTGRRPPPRPR